MLCPRCDGQGSIQRVRVNATGEVVQLCNECDAMWVANELPSLDSFQDFGTFMQSKGLQGLWSEITAIAGCDEC